MCRAALFVLASLFVLAALVATPAFARATAEVPYSLAEAFSTAVRFVRIDKNCKVTDQDPNAAFLTFECDDDGKTKRGSVEVWKSAGGSHLQVTLGDDPHYMELRWLELIARKLRDERGTPPPPPAAPARPQTPADGGA